MRVSPAPNSSNNISATTNCSVRTYGTLNCPISLTPTFSNGTWTYRRRYRADCLWISRMQVQRARTCLKFPFPSVNCRTTCCLWGMRSLVKFPIPTRESLPRVDSRGQLSRPGSFCVPSRSTTECNQSYGRATPLITRCS